jgi:hypothetical protein
MTECTFCSQKATIFYKLDAEFAAALTQNLYWSMTAVLVALESNGQETKNPVSSQFLALCPRHAKDREYKSECIITERLYLVGMLMQV